MTGNGAPDEIITAEVRPKLADEARRIWGVENNIYQFGHRGYVAVKGGAQDCPYTYMRDLAAGQYRLPWEDEVEVTDGIELRLPHPQSGVPGIMFCIQLSRAEIGHRDLCKQRRRDDCLMDTPPVRRESGMV